MKAYCKKCQQVTEFKCRRSFVRAGDRDFSEDDIWYCTECNFAPFIKPQEITEKGEHI